MKKLYHLLTILLCASGLFFVTACSKDAGDHLEDAGDSISDAAEDAGDSVSDAAEDAGDEIKDATN